MKEKDNHILNEELPPELEARILRSAAPILFQRKQLADKRRINLNWKTIFGSLAVTAVVAIVVVLQTTSSNNQKQNIATNADFLEHLDLLQVLPQLENDELLFRVKEHEEKAEKQWPKNNKRS